MKKVLAITCMLVLVLMVSSMAMAAESSWRFILRADNNAGAYMSDAQLGMYSTSLDGYDSSGTPQDKIAAFLSDPSGNQFAAWATAIVPGRTEAFYADIKAPIPTSMPAPAKSWNLRVYALKDATYSDIRLRFLSISTSTALQVPASYNGIGPAVYYIKMVNNRDVTGAPANGTQWTVPRPTTPLSTSVPFFTLVLPTGYGAENGKDVIINPSNPANAAAEGYVMEYGFFVPEPGGMLALGTGLVGLIGFFARRRRA